MLHRHVVELPSLEIFNVHLDMTPKQLPLADAALSKGIANGDIGHRCPLYTQNKSSQCSHRDIFLTIKEAPPLGQVTGTLNHVD